MKTGSQSMYVCNLKSETEAKKTKNVTLRFRTRLAKADQITGHIYLTLILK